MSESYSKSIADAVKNTLTADEWNFDFDEDNGLFRLGVKAKGPFNSLDIIISIRDTDYVTYVVPPVAADPNDSSTLAAIAEFFCRANCNISYGNFDLDFNDGEIRYRVFVDCNGIIPTDDMILASVYVPISVFERYAPGIAAVLFGSANPEEQIQKCEAAEEEE